MALLHDAVLTNPMSSVTLPVSFISLRDVVAVVALGRLDQREVEGLVPGLSGWRQRLRQSCEIHPPRLAGAQIRVRAGRFPRTATLPQHRAAGRESGRLPRETLGGGGDALVGGGQGDPHVLAAGLAVEAAGRREYAAARPARRRSPRRPRPGSPRGRARRRSGRPAARSPRRPHAGWRGARHTGPSARPRARRRRGPR